MEKLSGFFGLERNKKFQYYILAFIIIAGIFLRTYHFSDWLFFGGDQNRDATLVERVVLGKSAWPLLGPPMNHDQFLLGPIYYYFQIISVKTFGVAPQTLAYSDLFFGILTIPLFYFFLKKYFTANLSLAISGLFAVSIFAIKYSRFAWNSNSIPFFVILYLFSLHEFLIAQEKTRWRWVIFLGISIGVGMQLHAIALVLLLAYTFLFFIFSMRKNLKIGKKWAIVFLIVFLLNISQGISEIRNNFSNSKLFLKNSHESAIDGHEGLLSKIKFSLDCQAQTNLNIISSLGDEDRCSFFYSKLTGKNSGAYFSRLAKDGYGFLGIMATEAVFSILGYGLLFYYFKKEKDFKKKYFLGLIGGYIIISYLIMLPIGSSLRLRYHMHLVFLPFIFLGLVSEYLKNKFSQKSVWLVATIFLFFLVTNSVSIAQAVKDFNDRNKSYENYAVLGEMEPMVEYIKSKAYPKSEAYLAGRSDVSWVFSSSIAYIGRRQNFSIVEVSLENVSSTDRPVFFIGYTPDKNSATEIDGHVVEEYKKFGQFAIYKLQKI